MFSHDLACFPCRFLLSGLAFSTDQRTYQIGVHLFISAGFTH